MTAEPKLPEKAEAVTLWRIKKMKATGKPGPWQAGDPNPNEHTETAIFVRFR